MIDLKALRDDPERFRLGSRLKKIDVDIDRILELDAKRRELATRQQDLRAEQNRASKEIGPQIGKLAGRLKGAQGDEAAALEREIAGLKARPAELKTQVDALEAQLAAIGPELDALVLRVPLPPDADVPRGESAEDNVEIRRWNPPGFDTARSFRENRGFEPRSHVEIVKRLGLADFERGVKLGGTRHYVLTGMGARLHHAVLRYAQDFMVQRHGFTPVVIPVIVREEMMVGTGFFPLGRDQAYHIEEAKRGGGYDLFLTGTGEVSLMGLHEGEILAEESLPRTYVTVSTCFRREAGAAGKDTAGLYRIHQFDKVEQVVICRADEAESRGWHTKMIGFVEELLQSLGLPYRLLQCCTADLGAKNADMVDIESWMPGRVGEGAPTGAYGETHSASRLYDYQCRRLNMRYRPGGDGGTGATTVCHSLNNTVAASPRILIPLLEMYQNEDGSVTVPEALRAHMGGVERIG
ncbi:MAG: serine--tRNA ligase [Phycisphaeraceae bacterium]|nr:serine--tRNA ligase [Phycisphaeraceae bacterium]